MNRFFSASLAGFAGAATTNVLHEVTRRVVPDAPRVDLLGMQAMARLYRGVGSASPTGRTLYVRTLIGDIAANTAYFAAVGFAGKSALATGGILGVVAGLGAILVPPQVGLSEEPTARTQTTSLLTIALYTAGGIVSGLVQSRLTED